MARAVGKGEDLLGLLALGGAISVAGNLAQAEERRKLQSAYDYVVARYRRLEQEYATLRNYNSVMQDQVIALRTEIRQLKAEASRKLEGERKA